MSVKTGQAQFGVSLGVVAATIGCGTAPEAQQPPAQASASALSERPTFDPPRTFDTTDAISLPDSASLSKINLGGERVEPLPVLLEGKRVWISSVDRLEIVDVTSGTVTGTLRPAHEPALSPSTQNPFVGGNPAQPPVLADLNAQRRVVTAFATTAPGQGTTPPRPVIEVLAADAGTGHEAQRIEIEPSDDDQHTLTRKHPVVVGAYGPVVVAQVGTDTVAVNLDDRREVWRRPDFALGAVAGDVAVGTDAKNAVARALAIDSGAERWHTGPAETITIKPGSPKIVTATGASRGRKQLFRLLDAATGRLLDESAATSSTAYNITCLHDGRSVTICQNQCQDWAGAFDDGGKWLWELPDKKANRIAPTVTTAWHGAVYGRTANGPVIVDSRTGEDRETAPGLTPWLVNEHAAVASPPDASGGVKLYRATS
ncbi:hypothetical protein [Micromonospora sp. NPDC005197]|uniref:hypothetical protein n=1 Tax=Micromonospora sp. NPDC005197 TaxID=3157020 RepID=UPI0033B89433